MENRYNKEDTKKLLKKTKEIAVKMNNATKQMVSGIRTVRESGARLNNLMKSFEN